VPRQFVRVVSWNVNGIRSVTKKGALSAFTKKARADVLALQETRAHPDQLPPDILRPKRWYTHYVAAERKGYSGVGTWSRRRFEATAFSLGPQFDVEGRVQHIQLGALAVFNVYFPNGSGKDRDNGRVPFKLDFYRALFDAIEPLRASQPVLVLGDFNTAHQDIDLARPKQNKKTSGFLPEERAELDRWLTSGWTDTFRHLHPTATEVYSWWSQRFGVRERNVGWRIDHILASPAVLPHLLEARIHTKVMGSDHCPISVDLAAAVLGDDEKTEKRSGSIAPVSPNLK